MALQLQNELSSGVVGEYYKIHNLRLWADRETCSVEVVLYKDAAARLAGKAPISRYTYEIQGVSVTLQNTYDNIIELAYEQLKLMPEFNGAVDC